MITRLYIKDFILIRELELQLRDGFTSITGETGAGKSILVGAISLLLGNRADTKSIRDGASKAVVEADFDLSSAKETLKDIFIHNDLDYDSLCTIRREIIDTGKSRAFINDTPVTASVMKEIGVHLVDIHSQHNNMLIGDTDYQLSVLDTLAENNTILEEYHTAFRDYQEAKKRYDKEFKRLADSKKEEEFIAFQFQQLDEANLHEGEMNQLEKRQTIAQHSAEITEGLHMISAFTDSDERHEGVLPQLNAVTRLLNRVSEHNPKLSVLCDRLENTSLELDDIVREAEGLMDIVEVDPEELVSIETRLDLLQGLLYKFRLSNEDELIALRDEYESRLEELNNSSDYLQQLSVEVEQKHQKALSIASNITSTRSDAAKGLLSPLHTLMHELGIAGASFEVKFDTLIELSDTGIDSIQFLFATNNQTTLQPIRDIASGGEISRFMLALKTILAAHTTLPTVIFDEIDTGVSGEIAEKLGRVMQRLGKHIQVISITHLPQIAALATAQLVVTKEKEQNTYYTTINEVQGEDRVFQLATMLTGAKMTQAALENARELLAQHK